MLPDGPAIKGGCVTPRKHRAAVLHLLNPIAILQANAASGSGVRVSNRTL